MAGFLPGISSVWCYVWLPTSYVKNRDLSQAKRAATEEKVQAFKDAILALLMPVIILIFIETDTELTGIGEAATFGSSMDAMEFVVEKQLKSLLLDEDPTKIEFLHQKMMWNNWQMAVREWSWVPSAALMWLSGISLER